MTDVIDRPAGKTEKVVGTRPIRPDGADKVTGKAAYGADFAMPGQLVGKIKRSPHPHARIVSIDTSKARALPGVKAVITGRDLPEMRVGESVDGGEAMINVRDLAHNVMARDKALYEGHAVAAVAATSATIADQALALIEVTYEVLPHVIDVEAAMAPDAPLLHENLFTEGLPQRPDKPSNVAKHMALARGSLDEGFAAADQVVEMRFTAPPVHQGYIEPHACIANWSADGQSHIWSSSQGHFMVRAYTAYVLKLGLSSIKVTPAEIGGGFGGKTTVYLEPLALLMSRISGAPVKMVMSRDEVFRATGPTSGGVVTVKLGAKADGSLTAAEVEIKYQAGGFPGSPMMPAVMTAIACYQVPNFKVVGWDVVCNMPKVAAYRAPGAPMTAFAVESALDALAKKLGVDPLDLRLKNAARDGVQAPYGPTFQNIAFVETLEAVKKHPHYKAPLGPNQGRGVAAGFWFNHGGESSAAVHLGEDGVVTVVSANPDIGGSRASMAIMAAEVLGLPAEAVRCVVGDTQSVGNSMMTGGSRVTFATGMAVIQATEKVVAELRRRAAILWEVEPDQVEWRDGAAVSSAKPDAEPLGLKALAAKAGHTGGPISATASLNAQGAAPGFAVHLADVEVDPETGYVTVLRYTAAQDVGRAIHPSYVEGQMQGGAAQGIGWALNEEYIFDAAGRMENPGFLDYRVPVASDLPMIDTIMVEDTPNPRHPYGVKGVGEVPIVPPLATLANAVSAAIGVRMPDLPLSPPRIRAAVDAKG